jgi:two-component system, sensor histidine kinase
MATASHRHVVGEQVRAHYAQIPVMTLAPSLGGLFAVAVLWDAVRNDYLVAGITAVWTLSALRLWLYRRYLASPRRDEERRWRVLAIATAFSSGCIWGAAAPLLYPPASADHAVFVLVLLTLLPVVPVAALAAYMPTLIAYYVPCIAPFVVVLALSDTQPERMAALLLLAMMGAMLSFARKYSASLAEAITLEARLAAKADALEDALGQKGRFIAAASHDLRQPVHAMGLFVELLRRGGTSLGRREGLDYLAASLRSLRAMLDDMLHVSRLDARAVHADLRHFRVGPLLQRLRDEFAPQAAARGLDLRCRSKDVAVVSDPALLERMLRNLLSNALKFTSKGGIAMLCRTQGAAVRLQVCDTGAGIPSEHLKDVFEEFTQFDNRQQDDSKGLGLGLAIVERLARLMDHRIKLASTVGRGSTFTIELPYGRADCVVETASAAAAPAAAVLPPDRRVLIVDDDAAVRLTTTALVEQWGQRAQAAASFGTALTLAGKGLPPDLLIVDFDLGAGPSGLDLIRQIRQLRADAGLPAILITGDMAADHASTTHRQGIVLLRKPVDPDQLELAAAAALLTDAG